MAMNINANETGAGAPKWALITGAARRVGAHLARALAEKGYNLVLHYHQSEMEAEALKQALEAKGVMVKLKQADLRDHAAIRDVWHNVPPVSLLVHNASLFTRDTLASMRVEDLDAHFDLHVKAPLLLAQQFQAQIGQVQMTQGQMGHMVMLSDGSMGHSMAPQFFSYTASKMALSEMTDLLAASVAPAIRVNTLALGLTIPDTFYDADSFARIAQKAPLKRTSSPEDVAQALWMLEQNPAITGQILHLSGGMVLRTFRHAVQAE